MAVYQHGVRCSVNRSLEEEQCEAALLREVSEIETRFEDRIINRTVYAVNVCRYVDLIVIIYCLSVSDFPCLSLHAVSVCLSVYTNVLPQMFLCCCCCCFGGEFCPATVRLCVSVC